MARITTSITMSFGWRLRPCLWLASLAMRLSLDRLALRLANASVGVARFRIGNGEWQPVNCKLHWAE